MQEMSWRLVTQMVPILLQAFSCSALRHCPASYSSSELRFLLFQIGSAQLVWQAGIHVIRAGRSYCHKNEAETLSNLLRQAGANVTLRWQDSGHELIKQDVTSAARQWLAQRPNKDLVVCVPLLVCNAHRIMYAYTILTQHNLFSLAFFQTKALLFPQGLPSCYSVVNKICPYLPLSPRMSRRLLL
jgi:hypothetical protein